MRDKWRSAQGLRFHPVELCARSVTWKSQTRGIINRSPVAPAVNYCVKKKTLNSQRVRVSAEHTFPLHSVSSSQLKYHLFWGNNLQYVHVCSELWLIGYGMMSQIWFVTFPDPDLLLMELKVVTFSIKLLNWGAKSETTCEKSSAWIFFNFF